MDYDLQAIKKLRETILKATENLSLEQLNHIPAGFNNNVIWNMAHVVAAQQGICYLRSGLPMHVSTEFQSAYKAGTKPGGPVSTQFVEEVRGLLISTADKLTEDYHNGVFNGHEYTAVVTPYGVPISTIEEGTNFLKFHEGMHFGYILALKRAAG